MNDINNRIFFDSNLNIGKIIPRDYASYVIITDDNVSRLFARDLMDQMAGLKVHLITFPAGEHNKNRRVKEELEDKMLDLGCDRHSCIIALGGGVVSDMAGFIAATYQRGIDYFNIPTTLMAMVDASIGGKTALNTDMGKNMIGVFHRPKRILMNMKYLDHLPYSMYMSGLGEMMKVFLLLDDKYFGEFCADFENLHNNWPLLQKYIKRAVELKLDIVEQDLYDRNIRNILNLGHTVGHALEYASNYTLPHGYAVARGIIEESIIASEMKVLSPGALEKIKDMAKHWDIDFECNFKVFKEALLKDKKRIDNEVKIVMLEDIGKVHFKDNSYIHSIPEDVIELICKNLKKE